MTAAPRRVRPRTLSAVGIVLALLVAMTGCVKFNADFQVSADETLTGSMQILIDPVALEDMGSPDPSGDLDDSIAEAQSDPELPAGVTVDRVEDQDGYIGMGLTFDEVPATEFQSSGGSLGDVGVQGIEVTQADGEITFTMSNPVVAGMDSGGAYGSSGMPTSARSMFDEAIVSVGFPGKVVSADGAQIQGKTASWDLRDYDGDTLTAVGEASSFPWGIVLLVGGILLVLLVVAGAVVLILVLRRKNRKAAPVGQQPGPGLPPMQSYPGAQGQSGQPGSQGYPQQQGRPGGQGYPQQGFQSQQQGHPGQQPYGQPPQQGFGHPQSGPGTQGPPPSAPGGPQPGAPWQNPGQAPGGQQGQPGHPGGQYGQPGGQHGYSGGPHGSGPGPQQQSADPRRFAPPRAPGGSESQPPQSGQTPHNGQPPQDGQAGPGGPSAPQV